MIRYTLMLLSPEVKPTPIQLLVAEDDLFKAIKSMFNHDSNTLYELVPIEQYGQKQTMIVDEEGLLKGLPYNLNASVIAHQDIVGDAVIIMKEEKEYKH